MVAHKPIAGVALLGSFVVHASILFAVPRAQPSGSLQTPVVTELDLATVSAEPQTPEPIATEVAAARTRAPAAAIPLHAQAASPSLAVNPTAKAEATPRDPLPLSATSDEPSTPTRFVMTVGSVTNSAAGAAAVSAGAEHQGEAVYAEDGVDARPRLLTWQPPRYPASAASQGIEVDVPVDVVIDIDGAVTDVRLPKHFGYGLDEAATAAARSYRFSRGLKSGRPVRVRMRCTVVFRLN